MHSIPAAAETLLPAEDLPIGRAFDCGSYEVSEAEIIEFGSAWDPQYFHVDADRAATSDFGGLIASGLHTLCVYQRLAVTAVYQRYDIVAGRALQPVQFLRPVRAGDVLSCSVTVQSVQPDRPGRCAAVIQGVLHNQHGKPVLRVEVDCLIRSRSAGADTGRPGTPAT